MRLTLRNLLRFLDQADLRSSERNQLEQLVEESEKSDAWIQRIDALRRNPQAKPPPVESDSPSINQVAAYLDSSMDEPATVDFEKSMLRSDRLLAEVASCHEIREHLRSDDSPDIPVLLRQSVYDIGRGRTSGDGLPDDADSEIDDHQVAALAASMEDLPFVDPGPDDTEAAQLGDAPEDPEDEAVSLDDAGRRSRHRKWMLATVAIALLAAGFGLSYWAGKRAGEKLFLEANPNLAQILKSADGEGDPSAKGRAKEPTEDELGDRDSDVPGQDASNEKRDESGERDADSDPDAGESAITHYPRPEPPEPAGADDDPKHLPPRPVIDSVQLAESEPVIPESPPQPIAKWIEPQAPILIWSNDEQAWALADVTQPVLEESTCMVLPGWTEQLEIGDHFVLTVVGPARFQILRRDDQNVDGLQCHYGRFRLESKRNEARLRLRVRGSHYRLAVPLLATRLAVDAVPYLPPGDDPREVQPATVELLVASEGRVNVQSEDGEQWELAPTNGMAQAVSERPELTRDRVVGNPEQTLEVPRYVQRLIETVDRTKSPFFDPGSDVVEQLSEMKSDTRREVRFAAISWLAAIGNYSYLIDYLNEDRNRANWFSAIQAVRASIEQDPSRADQLFSDLDVTGAETQEVLYDLILGYSPAQLEQGGDEALVNLLDHDLLGARVLAIHNLRQITGGLAYNYQPHAERKDRRRIIERQWKRVLNRDELVYDSPPAIPLPRFSVIRQPGESEKGSDKAPSGEGGLKP